MLLTMSSLIIDFVESMVAFLASGVPNGELYLLSLREGYGLRETARIDRADLLVIEAALAEAECQRCLPHTCYIQPLIVNVDLPSPSTTILKEAEVFSIC